MIEISSPITFYDVTRLYQEIICSGNQRFTLDLDIYNFRARNFENNALIESDFHYRDNIFLISLMDNPRLKQVFSMPNVKPIRHVNILRMLDNYYWRKFALSRPRYSDIDLLVNLAINEFEMSNIYIVKSPFLKGTRITMKPDKNKYLIDVVSNSRIEEEIVRIQLEQMLTANM